MLTHAPLRAVVWRITAAVLLLLLLIVYIVIVLAGTLATIWLPSGDSWYLQLLSWLIWLIAYIISGLLGIIIFTTLAAIISSYWLDLLACRTEILYNSNGKTLNTPALNWLQSMQQSAKHSILPLIALLPWGVTALLLLFVPIIGPPLASLLWAYASARFLLWEMIDVPASRRAWSFTQRKQIMQQQPWFFLGFCIVATILMFVPIINLLIIPAAVVALSKYWAE